MSVLDDITKLDWSDASPPNLVEIGIKLASLEAFYIDKGLVLPDITLEPRL